MMRNAQDKTKGMNDSQTKQVMDATTERFKCEIGQEGPHCRRGHQGQSGGHRSKQRTQLRTQPQAAKDIRLPIGNFIAFPQKLSAPGLTRRKPMKELQAKMPQSARSACADSSSLSTLVAGPALRDISMNLTGMTPEQMAVNYLLRTRDSIFLSSVKRKRQL